MVPRIRAAAKAGKPPLAVLFDAPDHEWTVWDFRLIKALEIFEDMRGGTGIPVYWDRSDRVAFDAESYVSKSKAALDRAEERAQKGKSKNYGKIFYAVPRTVDGGPLPTLEEFLEEQAEKRAHRAGNIKLPDEQSQFSNANWKPKNAGVLLTDI